MRDVSLRSVEGPHHVSVQVARRARPGRSAYAWSMRTFLSQASEPASSSCRPRVRAARVGAGCCPSAFPAGCACARWPSPHPRTPQKRGPLGGRGGEAPRQPPPGTHRVWPHGVCCLTGLSRAKHPRGRRVREVSPTSTHAVTAHLRERFGQPVQTGLAKRRRQSDGGPRCLAVHAPPKTERRMTPPAAMSIDTGRSGGLRTRRTHPCGRASGCRQRLLRRARMKGSYGFPTRPQLRVGGEKEWGFAR